MGSKEEAFKQLKPVCVGLSQATLTLMGRNGNVQAVLDWLSQLVQLLRKPEISAVLDEKLADYVFYPLFHVLRQLEKLPLRAQENVLECIAILLRTAWKTNTPAELGIQLLILLSFIIDKDPTKENTSEELQTLAYTCIALIFTSLGENASGKEALVGGPHVPHIGKTVFTIVEGAVKGSTSEIQLAALSAIDAFVKAWPDRQGFSQSFFPGVISCLTKILEAVPSERRSIQVLSAAMDTLTSVIPTILGDDKTKDLPEKSADSALLDQVWLNATTGQVKVALSKILKLQSHERPIVRKKIGILCITCLQKCWDSLSECRSMFLETLTALAAEEESTSADLRLSLLTNDSLRGILQTSLYHWIVSLPRTMLSADDQTHRKLITQITYAYRLLSEEVLDLSRIDTILAANLRDSVASVISTEIKQQTMLAEANPTPSLELMSRQNKATTFDMVIGTKGSRSETINEVSKLVSQIAQTDQIMDVARAVLPSAADGDIATRISEFWLCLQLVRDSYAHTELSDEFLDLGSDEGSENDLILQQLYALSLDHFLGDVPGEEHDWRLQALALETVALQASREKENFRPELIDVLYPVVHRLGSSHPVVQSHAVTCLNIIADQCGYQHVQDMILSNVDYLVNAVGLHLHTLNPAPQAPLVLVMMVKLAGPSLLPYLDDLVESIFATLEGFHGYPKLVDVLFSALRAIVDVGSRNPQLAVSDGNEHRPRQRRWSPTTMKNLVEAVRTKKDRDEKQSIEDDDSTIGVHAPAHKFPHRPWGGTSDRKPQTYRDTEDQLSRSRSSSTGSEQETVQTHDPSPPAPQTYSLLLKITQLTQHYLNSSSLELRISLLALIKTIFPALAQHENSFLPLINTLWPVLLPRLHDSEAYVVSGALDAISTMCVYGEDFMRSRVEDAWRNIRSIHARCISNARSTSTDSSKDRPLMEIRAAAGLQVRSDRVTQPVRYQVEAPSRVIWESLVGLLGNLVRHVSVNEEVFDEIVGMLLPLIERRGEIRQILDERNPDTVWLLLERTARNLGRSDGDSDKPTGRAPYHHGKLHWRFAEILK